MIDREEGAKVKQDPPYIPTIPSMDRPATPVRHSFSVIGREEIVQSIPVEGLSAATEAAKECSEENSKMLIPKDKALGHYEHVHNRHFDILMVQTMKSLGLSLKWLDIIRPLIMEASRNVRTDVFSDDQMDINQYVKIKKIPRGLQTNSTLVYGVVCSKNVTHKKMPKSIKNPKILLLNAAFEFQRKENQLSSFDTLQLQEREYLKNLVVKVLTIKPNLILVQKSVSRLALEMLFDLEIVVALNVKPSVMKRVARCTKGEILHSLDQLTFATPAILGTCGHFYIKNFLLPDGAKKTLMYFDLCPPELGCVITLQGAPLKELKKVKKVTQFGLHIAYNSILETHFLVDEFAWPSDEKDSEAPSEDYSSSCSTPEWPLFPSLGYPLDSISQGELQKKLDALKFVEIEELGLEDNEQPQEIAPSVLESSTDASSEKQAEATNVDKEVVCSVDVQPSADEVAPDKILATVDEGDENTEEVSPPGEDGDASPESGEIQPVAEEEDDPSPDAASLQEEQGLVMSVKEDPLTIPIRVSGRQLTDKMLHKFAQEEFKLAQQSHIMSVSPYVRFKTPYLQTPEGRSADARQYLPNIVYWSYLFKPRNLLKNSQRLNSHSVPGNHLEMGLTKSAALSSGGMEPGQSNMENGSLGLNLVPTPPSYKSVSSHPFTSSIFLFQANSNEMRAALADFRARAGYEDEENTFLFKTAERASNYHLHLQGVFSNCREFEEAAAALEELPAHSEREASMAGSVVRAKKNWWEREMTKTGDKDGRRKGRDPFKRIMAGKAAKKAEKAKHDPKVDKSSDNVDGIVNKDNLEVSNDDTVVSDDIESVSPSVLVVSTDEEGVTLSAELMEPPTQESSSDEEGVAGKLPSSRTGKNRDSGGGGMKLGTLDDFDRKERTKVEKEEENMGDSNYETWLAADEVCGCGCVWCVVWVWGVGVCV